MKQYIGMKAVQAEPCMRGGKEGYRVVDVDGSESWSPKDVLEWHHVYIPDEAIAQGTSPQGIVDGVLVEYRKMFEEVNNEHYTR